MTKILTYTKSPGGFKQHLLGDELQAAFPSWGGVTDEGTPRLFGKPDGSEVYVHAPDDADETAVQVVIDTHDPNALSAGEVVTQDIEEAVSGFKNLPDYATWTPTEAEAHVNDSVLNGWSKGEADAWIDANVTNIASARTAFKQLAGAIIDLRNILSKVAKMLMWLRNIIIRTRT